MSIVSATAKLSPAHRLAIAAAFEEARTAWPDVQVGHDVFATFVAEHLSSEGVLDTEALERNALDLYLACACSHGNEAAISALEGLYFADEVDARCRGSNDPHKDDLRQRVRAKLFVGPAPK